MNWKHASIASVILLGTCSLVGCEKHRRAEDPQCYELRVTWADSTLCADADVRWLGQGDGDGLRRDGFEEVPLSPFAPVDRHGMHIFSWQQCTGKQFTAVHSGRSHGLDRLGPSELESQRLNHFNLTTKPELDHLRERG